MNVSRACTPAAAALPVSFGDRQGARLRPCRVRGKRLVRAVRVVASQEKPENPFDPPTGSSPPATPTPPNSQPPPRQPDFSDPTDVVQWGGELPSTRRMMIGGLTATGLALGSNFLGVTSVLLGMNPELAEKTKIDEVVPVQNFKRCVDRENGYEYLYPAKWLVDQRIVLRNNERKRLELDPLSPMEAAERKRRFKVAEPVSAYGPPAGSGEENVSVIVAPILPGFSFGMFGTPEESANGLLDKTIAPPGSEKKASLISAKEEVGDGELYFTMEYTVETTRWARHNFAVFVVKDGLLYTFNAQASKEQWPSLEKQFVKMRDSFRLL